DGLEEDVGLFAGLRERLQDLGARLADVRGGLDAEELPCPATDHPAASVEIEDEDPFVRRLEHRDERRLEEAAPLRVFGRHIPSHPTRATRVRASSKRSGSPST